MNEKVVGKCSLCGGVVTVPTVFMSVVPPVPSCKSCGAVMDVMDNLPTVPMVPRRSTSSPWQESFTSMPVQQVSRRRTRTRAEVRAKQASVHGCCNRHADNMGCDCIAESSPCPECNDTGYTNGGPMNGWNKGWKRCPNRCPVQCGICRNPECDNPNGQH